MGQRLDLQAIFEELLGSTNVYFQPPENIDMKYPCILYRRDRLNIVHADNIPYSNKQRYQVTVIDQEPDSDIPDKVAQLPTCVFDRFFTADNLNHDVFSLYF